MRQLMAILNEGFAGCFEKWKDAREICVRLQLGVFRQITIVF